MKTKTFDWIVPALAVCLAALVCHAANVELTWVPSTDTNVTNYRLYAWTNLPPTNCVPTNAVQVATVGNVTNETLQLLVPAQYTFAASAIVTNATQTNESAFSNFAFYDLPPPPTYLITVQASTNLITWSNTSAFFRLSILPAN